MAVTFKLMLDKPCLFLNGHTDKDGYVQRWYAPTGKLEKAHRIAYAEANGLTMADIAEVIVRHKCDCPPCVEPTHLLAGTTADNVRDMLERRRQPRGEQHASAKLTIDKVRVIKRRLAEGQSMNKLAHEFGISQTTISNIKHGRYWAFVKAA